MSSGIEYGEEPPPAMAVSRATAPKLYKIVLLGNSGVGKSNLLSRFSTNEFADQMASTIGVEFYTKLMDVGATEQVKAQIWDTAGQERYASMLNTYYRKASGALLVFDLSNRESFEGVERWRQQLLDAAGESVSLVLVGNKLDLASGPSSQAGPPATGAAAAAEDGSGSATTDTGSHVDVYDVGAGEDGDIDSTGRTADGTQPRHMRQVSRNEALVYAQLHHCRYVEASAKTGENVETAFHMLVDDVHAAAKQAEAANYASDDDSDGGFSLASAKNALSSSGLPDCC